MLLWNYFLTVTTDPGGVPDEWKPDTTEDGYEVKKLTGKPRYCRFCEKPKPPRAHHCKECKRCILRMGTSNPLLYRSSA
ncbi:Palmitoyltransferase [Pleurotus ostreatus]|nr:Palmitoyltransferase [Pleurotus ostreatus]